MISDKSKKRDFYLIVYPCIYIYIYISVAIEPYHQNISLNIRSSKS